MNRLAILAVCVVVVGCDSTTRTHMQAAEGLMKANEELQKTALEYQTVCMELRTVMQSRIDRLAADSVAYSKRSGECSARCAERQGTVENHSPECGLSALPIFRQGKDGELILRLVYGHTPEECNNNRKRGVR